MILELGPGADILRAIGTAYWLLALGATALVLWLVKKWLLKIPLALLVLGLFIYPAYQSIKRAEERKEAYMAKRRPAEALFNEKCKVANAQYLKAITPIENVESIQVLKVRPKSTGKDWEDQYWPGAALAREDSGGRYILDFLLDQQLKSPSEYYKNPRWDIKQEIDGAGIRMYRFVEVLDPESGKYQRVTTRKNTNGKYDVDIENSKFELIREPISKPKSRYAVTYEDDVDPENRKHWVAGTTIKVIDMNTNEVIGEQQFWAWDSGFGNTSQGHSPWISHQTCPRTDSSGAGWATHHIVARILKTKQGNE